METGGIWSVNSEERKSLTEKWERKVIANDRREQIACFERYQSNQSTLKELKKVQERAVLQNARVIGGTSTGVAMNKDLLESCDADVVIVEEAGEVLEAHVITSLTERVRQLILIGDHKQLRPKVQPYSLTAISGNGYGLDISMCERLINEPNLKAVMLNVQHRMRTEFGDLLRLHTYPSLRDAPGTRLRPSIRGFRCQFLFFSHRYQEDGNQDHGSEFKSKTNRKEAEIAVEIVRLILLQGYNTDQVVVLTPYLGQLRILQQLMEQRIPEVFALMGERDWSELERALAEFMAFGEAEETTEMTKKLDIKNKKKSVRVATIDNYQGEEADIVVLSLVRSNPGGKIGFLCDEKRVNVLLSRARNGLFILGNPQTLRASEKGSEVWSPILDKLLANGNMHRNLETFCESHPEDVAFLTDRESFLIHRPDGGCKKRCTFRMNCGHVCQLHCLPVDSRHEHIKCHEPCARTPSDCTRGHPCRKECFQECGPCLTSVNVCLPCGHELTMACHIVDDDEELIGIICKELVSHPSFENCEHTDIELRCHESGSTSPNCPEKCTYKFPCFHFCTGSCRDCQERGSHGQCKVLCEEVIICGHTCGRECHEGECKPCEKLCTVRCEHSDCKKGCFVSCSPCLEACTWECEQEGKCTMACGICV